MGILDRLATLIRSNVNDLLSRAEDPAKMLDQIVVDMRGQLAKAKQQVAAAIADERRIQDQAAAETKAAADWEARAMLAVREGRDELAKEALTRQAVHQEQAAILEAAFTSHRRETEELKASLRDLGDKIDEATRKKNVLLARQRRNEAHLRISRTMSSMSEPSSFEAFGRMEERIAHTERMLQASSELEGEFSGDRLVHDFTRLERAAGPAAADAQLLALKERMGLGGPAKRLPAGVETVEAVITTMGGGST